MMKKITKLLLIFVFNAIFGQTQNLSFTLPKIIPSSPTAQNFMRYGEIPVDHSTGVPNIDIPLYDIRGKKLSLPISISYHASGIKVNDIASEVGLGWVLNGEGLISRTQNGIRDEKKNSLRTYHNSSELLNYLNTHYLDFECSSQNYKGIIDFENFITTDFNVEDLMSDRYFYKIPNKPSGVFRYDYSVIIDNENSVITLPYAPIKIKRKVSGDFEITNEEGIVYTFKTYETFTSPTTTDWYLINISTSDGTENIKFNYTQASPTSLQSTPTFTYRSNVEGYMTCPPNNAVGSLSSQENYILNFIKPTLNSIESDYEIINFSYDSRLDF